MSKVTVTPVEFQQHFGCYREAAAREPLSVSTEQGDSLVLMSEAEYRRLKRRDRQALYVWELTDEEIEAIAKAEPPPETAAFDHELKS